jgi:uncharacterized protein YceH (UPF0502 family)
MISPDDVEIRVVACLVEKQQTTPDHYPLTLNSLRLACNQSTNRDPVVEYDEPMIRRALGELSRRRWVRSASGHTSRVAKYRHLLDVELNLPSEQLALIAVLMLRGPQTPGELKQRVDRMFHYEDLAQLQRTLDHLIERGYVERLERRPGQKEVRYRHLLGGGTDAEAGGEPGADAGLGVGRVAGIGVGAGSGPGVGAGGGLEAGEGGPAGAGVAPADTGARSAELASGGSPTVGRGSSPKTDESSESSGGSSPGGDREEAPELLERIETLEVEVSQLKAQLSELRYRTPQ